jgi:hypothetical protein
VKPLRPLYLALCAGILAHAVTTLHHGEVGAALADVPLVYLVLRPRRQEAGDEDGDGALGVSLTNASPQSLHVLASAGACGGDTQ